MSNNTNQPSIGTSDDPMGGGLGNPTGLTPRISPIGFTAGIFSVLAISILTIIFRIILRLQRTRILEVDDYFLIVSLILLISAAALQQYYRDGSYLILNVELGNIPSSAEFFQFSPIEAAMLDASSVLLWTSIFCIKFSFLFFFRKLISRVHALKVYWWFVVGFVAPSAFVCMFLGFLECPYFGPDFLAHCPVSVLVAREHTYLNTTVVLDIFTDVLIISLPVALLWNVKIPLIKKLTLLSMFGLSIVMIVIAIIRVTQAPLVDEIIDTIWLFFWQIMEAGIALVMVSISAFRGLFGQSKQSSAYGSGIHRGRTPTSEASKLAKPAAGERAVAQKKPFQNSVSSPHSSNSLVVSNPASFRPEVISFSQDAFSNGNDSVALSSSSFSQGQPTAIELQDVKSLPYQSRSQSRTRNQSSLRSVDSNAAGFADPHGTTSTHVWSDNDRRERSKERHGRWDRPSGASSRVASRSREGLDYTTGKRNASQDVSAQPENNTADRNLSHNSIARGIYEYRRGRNMSNDTADLAISRTRMSPKQWV